MFNISLSKFIKPHTKLSQYCQDFTNKVLPEYSMIIKKDEIFEYQFLKCLPLFQIRIHIELKREFNLQSIGSAQLCFYCDIFNSNQNESFYFQQNPDEDINIGLFLEKLNSNKLFWELYVFENLIKKWYKTVDDYYVIDKKYIRRGYSHTIISPHPIKFEKGKFKIIPGLIRYNLAENDSYLKRFDFCLIVSYIESDFILVENRQEEEEVYLLPDKFETVFQSKEIIHKLDFNKTVFNDLGRSLVLQSTEKDNEELYRDIEKNDLLKLKLRCRIESNFESFEFEDKEVLDIKNLWLTFQKLMENCEYYKTIVKLK